MAKGILQHRDFIVDYVRRHQPASRLRIAREFGMNPSTVGNIVDALIGEGLLVEDGARPCPLTPGRPPIPLRVNPAAGRFAGIDVYRTRVTGVVTDFSGGVLGVDSAVLGRQPRRAAVMAAILDVLGRLRASTAGHGGELRAVGIGLPGVVDREAGAAVRYRPILDWENVPVRALVEERFGVPVRVDHNSNAVALGEACCGDAAGYDHVVSILLRTGVSLGVVRHREIRLQAPQGAGELGHTVVRFGGRPCWCGTRGCLEAYASGWALQRDVSRALRLAPDWAGRDAFAGSGSFDPGVICRLAAAGDARATGLLRGLFGHLAVGIQTAVRLFAPDVVLVSGSFTAAGALLREQVLEVLNRPLAHPLRVPEVVVSSQDDRIGAVGAALMAASAVCNPLHRMP